MPQQVGKFDFTGIAPAGQAPAAAPAFDFSGIEQPVQKTTPGLLSGIPLPGVPQVLSDMLAKILTPDNLPAIGATTGGIIGGGGGTVLGFGVGGAPGAIGGATAGGATGEALRQLINRATGQEAPGTPAAAATGIAKEGAIQGAIEGAGIGITRVAKPIVKGAANALYRGYLKPSLAATEVGKAREIVDTAITEAIPMTKAGEASGQRLITELNRQVQSILANTKGTVDLHQVAEKVRAFAKQKYYKPGAPTGDFDAAMRVADEIDNHPSLGIPPGATPTRVAVSASKANETKQTLDQAIGDTAFGAERGAGTEARKAGRRELRVQIEGRAPDVAGLNARQSKLIDAIDAIRRGVAREENRNQLFGVPTILSGMAGSAVGAYERDPASGAAVAVALRMGMHPAVATRAAIYASKLAKEVPDEALPNIIRAAIELAQSERQDQPDGGVQRE
jgi:hypothetical protein